MTCFVNPPRWPARFATADDTVSNFRSFRHSSSDGSGDMNRIQFDVLVFGSTDGRVKTNRRGSLLRRHDYLRSLHIVPAESSHPFVQILHVKIKVFAMFDTLFWS